MNQTPESACEYSRRRRIELGEQVLRKQRIYLDQKYWIYCRDAKFGCPEKDIHIEIYTVLSHLVESRIAICPACYPLLAETLKARNRDTRIRHAQIIDELSRGVALQNPFELDRIEVLHFLMANLPGADNVFPVRNLVWHFAGYILGELIPVSESFGLELNNAVQKSVFDEFSQMRLVDIIERWDSAAVPKYDDHDYAKKATGKQNLHRHENASFEELFMSEVAGTVDSMGEVLTGAISYLSGYDSATLAPEQIAMTERVTRNLICHAFRLRKISTELPGIHIPAGIWAARRFLNESVKKGDVADTLHARAALPYCDVFLTERNLTRLLTSPLLSYDKAYGCRIISDEEDVLDCLRNLKGDDNLTMI